MHPLCARVTSLRQLLLCVRSGERHIVIGLAPIEMARLRCVAVLHIETTRITHIPIVVYFYWVGTIRRRCIAVPSVSPTVGDIVCESRTATILPFSASAAVTAATSTTIPTALLISTGRSAVLETPSVSSCGPVSLISHIRGNSRDSTKRRVGCAKRGVCSRWHGWRPGPHSQGGHLLR